jgi:hypothetical protein
MANSHSPSQSLHLLMKLKTHWYVHKSPCIRAYPGPEKFIPHPHNISLFLAVMGDCLAIARISFPRERLYQAFAHKRPFLFVYSKHRLCSTLQYFLKIKHSRVQHSHVHFLLLRSFQRTYFMKYYHFTVNGFKDSVQRPSCSSSFVGYPLLLPIFAAVLRI